MYCGQKERWRNPDISDYIWRDEAAFDLTGVRLRDTARISLWYIIQRVVSVGSNIRNPNKLLIIVIIIIIIYYCYYYLLYYNIQL
jgi:hypothetical protein